MLGFIDPYMLRIQKQEGSVRTIKIGLLIKDNNSQAAKNGAEMAIRIANAKGGFNGKLFELVIRSMEGPWGTGSKQAVDLIFEKNVCAVMASCDGRNGHLVEQVATKARIVFLSTWASDPTLAQAFVPWYFSCVPTDIQQADALIKEIYKKRKFTRIAVVSDGSYDSKLALESFLEITKAAGYPELLQLVIKSICNDFNVLIDEIKHADIQGIVLFGNPSASIPFIKLIEQNKMNQTLFGSLSLMDEDEFPVLDIKYYENVTLVSPGKRLGSKGLVFREEFLRTYGKIPGAVAAYSFDGMSLLIEAIKRAGLDRENIQKALSKLHFEGVTGTICFDDKGKRIGTVGLVEIKNGIPVTVER
jgi:branched-chain amino acid transport system substrate-binding protein